MAQKQSVGRGPGSLPTSGDPGEAEQAQKWLRGHTPFKAQQPTPPPNPGRCLILPNTSE